MTHFSTQSQQDFIVTDNRLFIKETLAELLELNGISYAEDDYFLNIGQPTTSNKWTLHLAPLTKDFIYTLEAIMSIIAKGNAYVQIAKSGFHARVIESGFSGSDKMGKLISISTPLDEDIGIIANKVIGCTNNLSGPAIKTAIHLGSIVFAEPSNIKNVQIQGGQQYFEFNKSDWPFPVDPNDVVHKNSKLFKGIYVPIKILKNDPKGRVIKAFDLRNYRMCIIKEACRYMCFDNFGRDVRDRLNWQHSVQMNLYKKIPLPKPYNRFAEEGNLYLVMEFKKGLPLSDLITKLFNNCHWNSLKYKKQIKIVTILKNLCANVDRLHQEGYVFRDLNPRNFLIDKKNRCTLIDFELSYNLRSEYPSPPFEMGTPGYMSLDQIALNKPTIGQDIYGIGGLLIKCLSGLSPTLFNQKNKFELVDQINYHIENRILSELICSCFSSNQSEQPSLSEIISGLDKFLLEIKLRKSNSAFVPMQTDLKKLIQSGVNGYSNYRLISEDGFWACNYIDSDFASQNETIGPKSNISLADGVSGILHLLIEAKQSGINLNSLKGILEHNFNYMISQFLTLEFTTESGLFYGSSGLALLMLKGVKAEWLPLFPELNEAFEREFQKELNSLSISNGKAGLGLCLLTFGGQWNENKSKKILERNVRSIISKQQLDGSWATETATDKIKVSGSMDFYNGTAGIIYFLQKYGQYAGDKSANESAVKGLAWLKKNLKRKRLDSMKFGMEDGLAGLAIPFIESYKINKDNKDKRIAKILLHKIPFHINLKEVGISKGMAGIGEVYLEASKVLDDVEWQSRADWVLKNLYHRKTTLENNASIWPSYSQDSKKTGFLYGSAGVINLLLKYHSQESIIFPLF